MIPATSLACQIYLFNLCLTCMMCRWQQQRVQNAFQEFTLNWQASQGAAQSASAWRHSQMCRRMSAALQHWQAWAQQQHSLSMLRAKLKAQQALRLLHFWKHWASCHALLQAKHQALRQQHLNVTKRKVLANWQYVALLLSQRRAFHSLAARWRHVVLLRRSLRVWLRLSRQMQVGLSPLPPTR